MKRVMNTEIRMKILILNGPNLNLLGKREPAIYGNRSFDDYLHELRSAFPETEIIYEQTNHEGVIIDLLQEYGFGKADAILLNAGGYTHTSIAIRDAVSAINTPVAEVHISDISKREPFRQFSYLTDVCTFTVMGHGLDSYHIAIEQLKGMC